MTSEREPVDDAALFDHVRLMMTIGASYEDFAKEVLRLAREGWQPPAPEPDRAEALACELWKLGETPILGEKEAIIRRHFDELRAEWEAERPVIDVPEEVLKAAELWKDEGFYGSDGPMILARFVKQLIDGAGVRAKGPSQ